MGAMGAKRGLRVLMIVDGQERSSAPSDYSNQLFSSQQPRSTACAMLQHEEGEEGQKKRRCRRSIEYESNVSQA
jgi:hypothetical protein